MPDRKHWRIIVYIAIVLFILCIPLLLLTSHLTWTANDLQLYEQGFVKYNVSRDTSISDEELHEVAVGLISYFNSGVADEALDIFDEREMIHLRDVRGLILINYHLQQQVPQFLTEVPHIPLVDSFKNLVCLLGEIALEGGMGLLPVPRAAVGAAQPGDDRHQLIEVFQIIRGVRITHITFLLFTTFTNYKFTPVD